MIFDHVIILANGQQAILRLSPTARKREEDIKVETIPENGLFWLRRLDRHQTISVHP